MAPVSRLLRIVLSPGTPAVDAASAGAATDVGTPWRLLPELLRGRPPRGSIAAAAVAWGRKGEVEEVPQRLLRAVLEGAPATQRAGALTASKRKHGRKVRR